MKTRYYLMFFASLLSLYFTSCTVIYPPLDYETNLQNKIDPPNEDNSLEGLFGNYTIPNQIRETPAITTYFATPNQPFDLSVIADYMVHEPEGLERLLINPASFTLNQDDKLYLSKLTLSKNHRQLIEITDFGSYFDEEETFSHALPNLTAPSRSGNTDHYEFIGYWNDGKNRTLAQGIWIDVTAQEATQESNTASQLNERIPNIIRTSGGATLATKGGKDEYEMGDNTKSPLKPGFLIGVSVPFQVSEMVSVEAGLQVETKGHIEKYSYEDEYEPGEGNVFSFGAASQLAASTFKNETALTYLGIPLIANISPFPQVGGFGFLGGLQPSFLLGRKSKSSGFGSSNTDKGTEGFKSLDLGILVGTGYSLENGLGFRLAYEHGLTDITENEFVTYQNRTVKLIATYDIPIKAFSKK